MRYLGCFTGVNLVWFCFIVGVGWFCGFLCLALVWRLCDCLALSLIWVLWIVLFLFGFWVSGFYMRCLHCFVIFFYSCGGFDYYFGFIWLV